MSSIVDFQHKCPVFPILYAAISVNGWRLLLEVP
jgi:hypothetical protein